MAVDNGTTQMSAGLASNSPIFSFRWGNSNVCLLRSVKMNAWAAGTAFSAGRGSFDLFIARSFTASDTTGTAITLTGNNNKKRTSMGTTLLTDMRISATATLTAGTRTLDANPIGKIGISVPPTSTNYNLLGGQNVVLWQRDSSDEYPIVFAQNEGFVIQATVPATGVWFFGVTTEWYETASF